MNSKNRNQAPRRCANCDVVHPVFGGEYVKSKDGLRQRWFCATCYAKHKK